MQVPEKELKIKSMASQYSNKDVVALKAELKLELMNKKKCTYQPFECTQMCIDGFKYCSRHILQDKSAPFKQCSFIFASNGKRCHLAAPKIEKKESAYCNEHALKATLTKNRQNSRCPPPPTAEVMLHSLGHYIRKPRNRNVASSDESDRLDDSGSELKATKSLDPFKDIDASSIITSSCSNVLDLCSESDSDVEPATYSNVWPDCQNDTSDNESVDSEQEDILKHANVYTPEEITLITRDKMLKLQSLYIEQYRHLQHVFKERKRKYIHSLKREKETCCNIYNQIRENPKEQRLYKKLKAYNKYHKLQGNEAILSKRNHDVRAKITDGIPSKTANFSKCMFTEGGVKCGERTLPLAKHCRKHILEDPNQVLFKPCGKTKSEVECLTPIETIFEDSSCRLHMDIPPIKSYAQLRKNSESDFEDSFDTPMIVDPTGDLSSTDNVKTELLEVGDMKTLPSVLFEESSSEYFDNKRSKREEDFDDDIDVEDQPDESFKLHIDGDEDDDEGTKTASEMDDENSMEEQLKDSVVT